MFCFKRDIWQQTTQCLNTGLILLKFTYLNNDKCNMIYGTACSVLRSLHLLLILRGLVTWETMIVRKRISMEMVVTSSDV